MIFCHTFCRVGNLVTCCSVLYVCERTSERDLPVKDQAVILVRKPSVFVFISDDVIVL